MRYGMMIELDKCIGCQACVSACKERWDSGPGAARDWVQELEHGERGKNLGLTFYPGLCNHCADHPCTEVCPTAATTVNEHGVVMVDPEVCIGCGNCVSACPYGARRPDAQQGIVEKCNFCAPYVARGEQPACVATCLAGCRHFGDLDDPSSEVAQLIKQRDARPLETAQLRIGPKVYYAPEHKRQEILGSGAVGRVKSTTFTGLWQGLTRPAARLAVPAFAVVAGLGGLLVNLRARKLGSGGKGDDDEGTTDTPAHGGAAGSTEASGEEALPRHRLGMRFLHWFNVASWLLLVLTGTALMITPAFALFGTKLPHTVSGLLGGQAGLIKLHVGWGLLWAVTIVPLFLYFKRGGIEALREIRPTRNDLRWMMAKPLVMLGLSKGPLPPQDKYNAGQKAFALSALAGTTVIIISGLMMTFHLGSPQVMRAAILAHKLAVLLALMGLAVHITMAAIIADERPALRSMLTGRIDRHHAEHHSENWVKELEESNEH